MSIRTLLPIAAILCLSESAFATTYAPRTDLGVVCLDEETGERLWEYFPGQLGNCQLATDGDQLFMVMGPMRRYLMDPFLDAVDHTVVQAVDLKTLKSIEDVKIPDPSQLKMQVGHPWSMVTSSGLRVAGRPGDDRQISILKPCNEKPDELVRMIDTHGYVGFVMVYRNLVIYSLGRSNGQSGLHLVAHNVKTGLDAWTLSINGRILGFGKGRDHLFICEKESLAFVDPKTGEITRRTPLPHARGWSMIVEENGRIYVQCEYLSSPPTYYFYCIDSQSGEVLWTFDPGGSLIRLPILVNNGKVYTLTAPSPLFARWHNETRRMEESFFSKTTSAQEVQLRAWHQLGDRAALPVMKRLREKITDENLLNLMDELTDTFPHKRDVQAFLKFLMDRYDAHPEDEAVIRELLENADPIPYWLKSGTVGFPPQPAPKLPIDQEQASLYEMYRSARKKLDLTYGTRLGRDSWYKLSDEPLPISFEALLSAFEASNHKEFRVRLLATLLRYYPKDAIAWVEKHLDGLDASEFETVVSYAPVEWLTRDTDRLIKWVKRGGIITEYISGRMPEFDPELTERVCVGALEDMDPSYSGMRIGVAMNFVRTLGRLKACGRHRELLERFLISEFKTNNVIERYGDAERVQESYALESTIIEAFKACGIKRKPLPLPKEKIIGPENDRKVLIARKRAREFHQQMQIYGKAGAKERSRNAARKLLTTIEDTDEDFTDRIEFKIDALLTLERWDEMVDEQLNSQNWYADHEIFKALVEADRYDELERFLPKASDPQVARDTAFILIDRGRFEAAKPVLLRLLDENPSDIHAYIGLALIFKQEGQVQQGDRVMMQAMALNPTPWFSDLFCHTITYWLDRDNPDEARRWVVQSSTADYKRWNDSGLFKWAAGFGELRHTVNQVRVAHGDDPISNCGTIGIICLVACPVLLGAMALRHSRKFEESTNPPH